MRRSAILELQTNEGTKRGHEECADFLARSVAGFLQNPSAPDTVAQDILLKKVKKVFSPEDNALLEKLPDREEVFRTLAESNHSAAPGMDALTSRLYYKCFEIFGETHRSDTRNIYLCLALSLSK